MTTTTTTEKYLKWPEAKVMLLLLALHRAIRAFCWWGRGNVGDF